MKRKWLVATAAGIAVLAGALLWGVSTFTALAGAPANAIAVDAIAGGAVDGTLAVPSGETFAAGTNVTTVTKAYSTYQFKVRWDSGALSFVSGQHHQPDGFTACFAFTIETDSVSWSCGRPDGPSNFVGQTNTLTFQCVADGTTTLHLVSLTEDPVAGTTTIDASGVIETALTDATITCGAGGPPPPPGSTATPTPPGGPPPGSTATPVPPPITVTPLPGERAPVELLTGCNVSAFEPFYPAGTDLALVAVDINAGNPRIWLQRSATQFDLYDPRSVERSSITTLTQEAGFICLDANATWNRPVAPEPL